MKKSYRICFRSTLVGALLLAVPFFLPFPVFAQGRTVIDMTPGIEFTHIDRGKSDAAAGTNEILTTIFGNAFSSFAQTLLDFANCQKGKCAEVPNFKEIADQQFNLYDPQVGGYVLPQSKIEEFEWAIKPTDEQRYQWFSNKCATGKQGPLHSLEKMVNPIMAMTKENQKDISTIAVGEQINAAISGVSPPITSTKFDTPKKEFFEIVNGVPQLKKEHEGLAQECTTESAGSPVPAKPEEIVGYLGGGPTLNVTTSEPEALDYAGGFVYCLLHIRECIAKTLAYTLNFQLYSGSPGHPKIYSFILGRLEDSDLPSGVNTSTRTNLTTDKRGGFAGTTLPQNLLAKFHYNSSHGSITSAANVTTNQSPQVLAADSVNMKYSAAKGIYQAWFYSNKCAPIPLTLQKNPPNGQPGYAEKCIPEEYQGTGNDTPTSNLANGIDDFGSDPPTRGSVHTCTQRIPEAQCDNSYVQEAIRTAASQTGIPQCVLEAVGIIEGAYHWSQSDEKPMNQCYPNPWGAAGPFQITVGRNTLTACVNSPIGYCPNAWKDILGNPPGSACNVADSALGAAGILKYKSRLTNSTCGTNPVPELSSNSWESQKDSIRRAACGYYGSDRLEPGIGNISYADFVLKHCETFPTGVGSSGGAASGNEIKIMALGDSITRGMGGQSYQNDLTGKLSSCNAELVGKGIGGATTSDIVDRLKSLTDERPSVVLLMIGTNNAIGNNAGHPASPEQAKSDLETIVDRFKASGATVILSTIPPIAERCDQYKQEGNHAQNIETVNGIIRKIGGVTHVTLPPFGNDDYIDGDCVHPKDSGNQKIADTFASGLRAIPEIASCVH